VAPDDRGGPGHYEDTRGLTVLSTQDFGAKPGDLNPLGYRDSIGQPAIVGTVIASGTPAAVSLGESDRNLTGVPSRG
jgi:hypothetical protein